MKASAFRKRSGCTFILAAMSMALFAVVLVLDAVLKKMKPEWVLHRHLSCASA